MTPQKAGSPISPLISMAFAILIYRCANTFFISIDDNEVDNLRKICNEIFCEENFVGTFVWQKRVSSEPNDIVLDFFAGTGTTAAAVLGINTSTGTKRHFILVQLPEPTDRAGFRSIADITEERVRRVIQKLDNANEGKLPLNGHQSQDRGFRVFKLAESNFKTWNANVAPGDVSALQQQLELHIDHIRDSRTADDEGFTRILRACSIISLRYNVIASLVTNEQERVYNAVAEKVGSATLTQAAEIIRELRSIYLSDDRFRNAFAEKSLKTTQTRNKRVVRYLLFQLERQVSGKEYDFESERYSIEHVLPENPGTDWAQFADEQLENMTYRLGNLTLLASTVNRDLGNKSFVEKREVYRTRVVNYRDYNADGQPIQGKFARAFEAALAEMAQEERYRELDWLKLPSARLHNGYFAQDKKGVLKDTRGDTQADDEVYNLIMKDKERLLSLDEPLRFIFSHSALREGWDSPNVFQVCTLNETRSTVKKRQEIGRGLRLPVDQSGQRVFDASVNRLFVVANESYEDFARALQTEYEEDCGVTFGQVPITALAKLTHVVDGEERPIGLETAETIRTALMLQGILDAAGHIQPAFDPRRKGFALDLPDAYRDLTLAVVDLLAAYQIERHIRKDRDEGPNHLHKDVQLSPEFQALWERIKPKTTYRVEFETDELVTRAVAALYRMDKVEPAKIHVSAGQLGVTRGGITATAVSVADEEVSFGMRPMPDMLAYLQNETELTRSTLVRILKASGRLAEFFVDPQRFMDAVSAILKHELHRLLVDGIKYERLPSTEPQAAWEMMLFKHEELINYLTALQVQKSIYEYVVYDSEVEREFARRLDQRQDIKLFVKLPGWFEIDTPVGKYNPDWAILKVDDQTLYLVRETKATRDFLQLRTNEADKVRCGQRHFEALGIPFKVAVSADEV